MDLDGWTLWQLSSLLWEQSNITSHPPIEFSEGVPQKCKHSKKYTPTKSDSGNGSTTAAVTLLLY